VNDYLSRSINVCLIALASLLVASCGLRGDKKNKNEDDGDKAPLVAPQADGRTWPAQTWVPTPANQPPRDEAGVATALEGKARPNIIVMMTDNVGWGEIGTYGGGVLRGAPTPRLDSLAADGMKLLNFNVEPQCTPSRSAFMTGRHPIRSGTTKVVWGMLYGLTQWEVTIAELLSKQGYATGMYGKWHLGDTPGRLPIDQGFDEWYGIPNTTDESLYADSFQYDKDLVTLPEVMEGTKGNGAKKVGTYNIERRRTIDSELVDKAVAFMKKSSEANKPFFVFMPFTQAHLPTLPHPDFDGKTGNGHYADVIAEMDHRAGQILDAVDELGARDNTIVIWTSDNGPEEINPWHGTAGYWRGTYFTALEGSLRTSFLIRWPAKIQAGSVSNEIVHMVDLLPTLARVGGASAPTDRMVDGVNQLPFLLGAQGNSNRVGFPVYNGDTMFAYKYGNWKLHLVSQDSMLGEVRRSVMPRLYHLLKDPKENYDMLQYEAEAAAWVMPVIAKAMLQFNLSLREEPPIALGTPDPYRPKR
jgi:arylsulfatase